MKFFLIASGVFLLAVVLVAYIGMRVLNRVLRDDEKERNS